MSRRARVVADRRRPRRPAGVPLARAQEYDVVIRGGTVYDGSGRPPVVADVAVRGDTIAAVGDLRGAKGTPRDRRPRPGRRPRVHQHAELGP